MNGMPVSIFGYHNPRDFSLHTPLKVNYIKTHNDMQFIKHDDGDAGFDMYVTEDTWIFPFRVKKVPVNLKCEIPRGYYGFVTSRSGETSKGNIVIPGIIDSTYRGTINALVTRVGLLPRRIKRGTRIAQMIFHQYKEVAWNEVESLTETDRGEKGFGSSGVI